MLKIFRKCNLKAIALKLQLSNPSLNNYEEFPQVLQNTTQLNNYSWSTCLRCITSCKLRAINIWEWVYTQVLTTTCALCFIFFLFCSFYHVFPFICMISVSVPACLYIVLSYVLWAPCLCSSYISLSLSLCLSVSLSLARSPGPSLRVRMPFLPLILCVSICLSVRQPLSSLNF